MIYQVEVIKRDVRVALDENVVSRGLVATGDVDTLALDEIIVSKIADAAREVEMAAPVYLLDSGHNFADAVYRKDEGSGWTLLPDDFMRLVVFKMSDWERPVYTAISSDMPQYAWQHSRFKGIRGTAQKPVCAIVKRPEGLTLEFWSCKSDEATVEQAVYLPYPEIDCSGGIEICERCYRDVVMKTAEKVSITLGTASVAQSNE